MTATIYQITVEREPGFWIIRVPDLEQVVTQARRFSDVRQNARDAIAVWLDQPIEAVDVKVTTVVPPKVQAAMDEARRLRLEANEHLERAGKAMGDAAHRLTKDLGLTLREAADILGVSFQRVAQLLEDGAKANRSRRSPR
jgi:predicted RNase H-like HicB family nuclease